MSWLEKLSLAPRRRRREVDIEIDAHLEMRVRQLIGTGMDADSARAEAIRRFGNLDAARQRLYASAKKRDQRLRRANRFESVIADLGAGLRRLRQDPATAALSVATFALGIGLTTATFSVVDHALLRPLPFNQPDELVALHSVNETGSSFALVSGTNWMDWDEQNRTLQMSAIYSSRARTATIVTSDDAFSVPARYVSGRFFETLRTPFVAGRALTTAEVEDREAVAVVSEGFWRRVLGADPELPGTLSIAGRPTRIVGVVRGGFEFPEATQVWLPAVYRRLSGGGRNNINWKSVARLAPEATADLARVDLSLIADAIRAAEPAGIYSYGVGVVALKEEIVGDVQDTLTLAMSCVLAVLLVSCANLAGLEFSRRSARSHETAVRVALGASRWRIIQQGVLEQVALAITGGMIGTALAWWGTGALLSTASLPRSEEVVIDLRILGFALGISVLAGVIASVLPSFSESRADPGRAMGGGRGAVRGGRNVPGAALVAIEVAVAVILLVAGGLMARNFSTLVSRDLGFDAEGVVAADITLTAERYRGEAETRIEYWRSALETLGAIPGVVATAAGNPIPTGTGGTGFVAIEKQPDVQAGANYRVVSRDYFSTLRVPVVAGRLFEPGDVADSERVTIISREMAETYWPDANPVGERIQATSQEFQLDAPWLLIIGVVEDIRQYGFASDAASAMYVLLEQVPTHTTFMTLMARVSGDPTDVVGVVRDRLRSLDGELAVGVRTLDDRLGGRVASERLLTTTLSLFAALGLALAAIGIYGLLSFAVNQRTREIAVRMAIGARAVDVVGMVLRNAMLIVVLGLAVGLSVAYVFGYLVEALLVDVAAGDPLTFVGVATTVLLASLAAALVPAVRAVRKSPLDALRQS